MLLWWEGWERGRGVSRARGAAGRGEEGKGGRGDSLARKSCLVVLFFLASFFLLVSPVPKCTHFLTNSVHSDASSGRPFFSGVLFFLPARCPNARNSQGILCILTPRLVVLFFWLPFFFYGLCPNARTSRRIWCILTPGAGCRNARNSQEILCMLAPESG